MNEKYWRLNQRQTAYHESGHAIIKCLFGEGEHIDYVALHGTDEELGRIQIKPGYSLILQDIHQLLQARISHAAIERKITRYIVYCFAGDASEQKLAEFSRDVHSSLHDEMLSELGLQYKVGGNLQWYKNYDIYEEWWETLFSGSFDCFYARNDFELASGAAFLLTGDDEDKVRDFLDRCAKIADRFVNNARIWSCINLLAIDLLESKSESLLGDVIHEKYSPRLCGIEDDEGLIELAATDASIVDPHCIGFLVRR